jgi:hypothetical protein
MANKTCDKCGTEITKNDKPIEHTQSQCIDILVSQVMKLKTSVADWKDEWFHLRDIIGKLWWEHPAIHDDEQRTYYQVASRYKYEG